MYEERRDKFTIKDILIQVLFVALFIFLLMWLFPMKKDVKNALKNLDIETSNLQPLYDQIFNNNVQTMKEAAISYYTTPRLPEKIGDEKKMTLSDMLQNNLILPFVDSDGNQCDLLESYVSITKMSDEYILKVNLKCGNYEDYVLVHLGCYNYCDGGICEKRVPTPNKTTTKEEKPTPEEPSKDDPKPENPISKEYLYEYKLVVNDSKTCENWTEWGKNKITATDLVKVETKTQKELTGYKTVKVPVTKTETIKKEVTEKYISRYITQLVLTGTKDVQIGTTTKTVTEKVKVGTIEVATGEIGSGSVVPQKTSTKVYKVISKDTPTSCSYCENETIYTWEVYTIEPVYEVKEVEKEVPVYKTINVYETKEVPVYDFRTVEKEETVTKTVYETKKIAQYGDVTYYRSQTCKITKGYTDIKWSKSKIDSSLLGKGYKLTGNVKEA